MQDSSGGGGDGSPDPCESGAERMLRMGGGSSGGGSNDGSGGGSNSSRSREESGSQGGSNGSGGSQTGPGPLLYSPAGTLQYAAPGTTADPDAPSKHKRAKKLKRQTEPNPESLQRAAKGLISLADHLEQKMPHAFREDNKSLWHIWRTRTSSVRDSKQLAECVMFLEAQLTHEVQAQGWQKQLFTQAKDAWIDPKRAYQLVNLLEGHSPAPTPQPPPAIAVPVPASAPASAPAPALAPSSIPPSTHQ